jgi:phosphohistidine phosphatase SixA
MVAAALLSLIMVALLLSGLPAAAQQASTDGLGAVPPAPARSSQPKQALAPAALVAELRKGGYVLYVRHAATDFSQNDAKSQGPTDCDNQRNLSKKGRIEAQAVGRALQDLAVPVGQVLASPMCRTNETARLMFGKAEPSVAVRGDPAFPSADPRRYTALGKIFTTPVPTGTNLGIASHGNPFHGVAGPPYIAEGELAVIKPIGGDFEVVARIKPVDWARLVACCRVPR